MAARSRRLPAGVRRPEWSVEKQTLDHFERFAYSLTIPDTGRPFRLEDWQLVLLEDYFDGPAEDPTFFKNLWELPTGQGKSALLGALALHHCTYCVPKPRLFVLGGLITHARNTTDAAAGFITESRLRNGTLGSWWEAQEHTGGRLLPLWLDDQDVGIFARGAGRKTESTGGDSVEGKNPTGIFVEELHRHADGGTAMNTLITKTIKGAAAGRMPRIVVVTTAGTSRESPLGRLEDEVLDEKHGAAVERKLRPAEFYTRGVSKTGTTVGHIWAIPDEFDAPRDETDPDYEEALTAFLEKVKRCNPASWVTVKILRVIWDGLDRKGRWTFVRQHANKWVTAGFALIDRSMWWRLQSKGLQIPPGKGINVHVGLDRANKWDSTAIVPVWQPPDGGKIRVAGAVILKSPRDGNRRRTRDVADILNAMHERWPDMVIVFDRNAGGGDVAEEFEEDHSLTIIDHGQGNEFDLASMRLVEIVEEGKLEHDGNELLAQHVLAAVMKETSGGRRFRGEAPDEDTQIDGFDALAMAINMAAQPAEEKAPFNPDDYRIQQL